jgi:hypothetical protein
MGCGVAFRINAPYRSIVQCIRHLTANPSEPVDAADMNTHACQSSARYGTLPNELFVSDKLHAIEDAKLEERVSEMILCSKRAMELWFEVNDSLEGKQNDIRDEINCFIPQGAMGYLDLDLNLWSLRNFLIKRLDKHAQATLREIALQMYNLMGTLPEFSTYYSVLTAELLKLNLIPNSLDTNT